MESLILRDVPMRTAHDLVGKLVGEANRRGVTLKDLPDDVFQEADASLDASVKEVLGVQNAVAAFKSYGSTNPEQVAMQVQYWRERLSLA